MDLSNIKRSVSEPKVYALMVESARGQVLHLGVHFSLEEAYSAARMRLETLAPHKPGEPMDIDLWNTIPARQVIAQLMDPAKVDELIPLPEGTPEQPVDSAIVAPGFLNGPVYVGALPPILEALLNSQAPMLKQPNNDQSKVVHTVSDYIQDIKTTKNDLMKKLIEDGDVAQVDKLKTILGAHSRRYVLKAIENKAKMPPPPGTWPTK